MMLSFLIASILFAFASARISCPTFFGAHDTSQLEYPTPDFKVTYDNATGELTLVVTTVYDPYAALVIDFEPYVSTRKSLKEVGKCENREDTLTKKWSWRRADYSACIDDEDNLIYYPEKGHAWTRTDRDCNLVEYTYRSTLSDLVTNCGSSLMGWREVDGKRQFYGNVYVSYVRPDRKYSYDCIVRVDDSDNCHIPTVYAEQQVVFYLTDVVTTTSTSSCSDNGTIVIKSDVVWKQDGVNLNIYTNVPNPTERGLLCSFEPSYTGTANLPCAASKKECACAAHCNTSTFCTSTSTSTTCIQQWAIQSSGEYKPGSLHGGKYNLAWKVNNCTEFTSGLEECVHQPTATCIATITVSETVKASYEYKQPLRPFGALLVRQPPEDNFDYSFSDKDLKAWVRVSPLVGTKANVIAIEYCEADSDGLNCSGTWTSLKTWNEGEISENQYVEASVVITKPKNKVFLFRVIGDKEMAGVTTLILDTHSLESSRIAPIPTTYVNVDKTYCGGDYEGDPDDGFLLENIDVKKIIKLAGAILATIAVA